MRIESNPYNSYNLSDDNTNTAMNELSNLTAFMQNSLPN